MIKKYKIYRLFRPFNKKGSRSKEAGAGLRPSSLSLLGDYAQIRLGTNYRAVDSAWYLGFCGFLFKSGSNKGSKFDIEVWHYLDVPIAQLALSNDRRQIDIEIKSDYINVRSR